MNAARQRAAMAPTQVNILPFVVMMVYLVSVKDDFAKGSGDYLMALPVSSHPVMVETYGMTVWAILRCPL